MRSLVPILIFTVLLAPAVFAETAAGAGDVPKLIKQLGDDDPKLREEASQKLHRLGSGALSALTEATKSSDPEVVSRAQTLLRQIDEDLHPKPVAPERVPAEVILRRMQLQRMQAMQQPQLQLQQRVQAVRVSTSRSVSIKRNADGEMVKDITVTEAGRTVKIHESPDGIAIKTTAAGQDNVVEAKDKAELKKEHPAEFALYEKYSAVGGGGLEGAAAMRLDLIGPDRALLEQARMRIEQNNKIAQEQLRQVEEQMQQMRKQMEQDQMRKEWEQLLQKKPQQQKQEPQ
jgi:hypothetical protein